MAKLSFIPTRRLIALAYAGAVLWLFSGSLAMLYMLALAVCALIDLWKLPSISSLRINVVFPQRFELGRASQITTEITNESRQNLNGTLYISLPILFSGLYEEQAFELSPGETVEIIDTTIPHVRGEFQVEDAVVICKGTLGLVRKAYTYPIREKLKVFPEFKLLKEALLLQIGDISADYHRNPFYVCDNGEFDSLRPYVQGESLRNIEWKASAKRGELISKERTEDLRKHLFLLIDCGRKMAEPTERYNRLDYALGAAIQLGYAAADRNDSISMMAFSDRIDAVMPEAEKEEILPRMLDTVFRLKPKTIESDYWQVFGQALLRMNKRSLIVLFSDLLDISDSSGMLSNLAKASNEHLVLCIVMANKQILTTAASTPSEEAQWYAKGAACHIAMQRATVLEKMKSMGIKVLEAQGENFSLKVVEAYLKLRKDI